MSRRQVFFSRLLSTVLMWGLGLWTIFSGYEPAFFVMLTSLGLIGLWEFYQMLAHKDLPHFKWLGMGCGALLSVGGFYYYSRANLAGHTAGFPAYSYDFEVATLVTFMLVVSTRQLFEQTRDTRPLQTIAYTLFGLMYVPWLFSFVTKIVYLLPRDAAGHTTGHWYVLYLLTVTKFSDMGAYLTGSLFGKHLLIPHISPKKTREGFVGALMFSTGGSIALRALLPQHLGQLTYLDATVLGLGLGFAAVVGDLAESVVKRSTDTKDSGRILPGIGGALDLIDSLLFTAPLLFFYLRFAVGLR